MGLENEAVDGGGNSLLRGRSQGFDRTCCHRAGKVHRLYKGPHATLLHLNPRWPVF